jgi:hypothetical protein
MNRRETLKQLLLASGGLIALPSWASEWSIRDLAGYSSSFTLVEQEILAMVTDTIIPAGDSIGALSVGVDKFLQKLLDHCYESATQENVKSQLSALNTSAEKKYAKSFAACDHSQRQELLLKLAVSENKE